MLDWSDWLPVPLPAGHVAAIAASRLARLEGAIVAATDDGAIHYADYQVEGAVPRGTRQTVLQNEQWCSAA